LAPPIRGGHFCFFFFGITLGQRIANSATRQIAKYLMRITVAAALYGRDSIERQKEVHKEAVMKSIVLAALAAVSTIAIGVAPSRGTDLPHFQCYKIALMGSDTIFLTGCEAVSDPDNSLI
jgi:hypothetical protein